MKKLSVFLLFALFTLPLYAQAPAAPTPTPAAPLANLLPPDAPAEGFSALAEKLLPAVVNISTTQTIKDKNGQAEMPDFPQFPPGSPFEDFFKDFMEKHKGPSIGGPVPRQRKTTSLGSGFIIDGAGYVVTNNHVIQDADEINVILHDDTSLKAEIIGRDAKTDVALLKVSNNKPLPSVSFGDSDKVKVGDWTVVIGNPFGLGGTVTAGIISARARDINSGPYDDYLQTDASINRGNSGGPMFNLKGEVIGMSTAIFSPSGGSVGIGFAIPSALVSNVVAQLKSGGKIHRGWLGVRIQNVTEEIAKSLGLDKPQGALVSSTTKGGPADKAGVQAGDVILHFDNKPITEMRRLPRVVAEAGINRTAPITVWRDGKELKLTVTVGELKEDERADAGDDGKDNGKQEGKTGATSTSIPEFDVRLAALTPDLRKKFDLSQAVQGLVVTAIGDDSPFTDKGIQPGDVIVEAAQKEMKTPADFAPLAKQALESKKPLLLLIDRAGDIRFVAVNAEKPIKKKP